MKPVNILIADDHGISAEMYAEILKPVESIRSVSIVTDGMKVVKAASARNINVLISDISMPYYNGLTAMSLLEETNPDLKIIFTSSINNPHLISKAIRKGAAAFLLKYVDAEELKKAVISVINGEIYLCSKSRELIDNPSNIFPSTTRNGISQKGFSFK